MRSILSVTVMSAVNSLIKIDAVDPEGIQVVKFYPQTNDVDQLNGYIVDMIYNKDVHGQNKDIPVPQAPVIPASIPPPPPKKTRVKDLEVQAAEAPSAPPAAVSVAQVPVTPAPAIVAPTAPVQATVPPQVHANTEVYLPEAANQEHRAILGRLCTEALGGKPIPASVIANLEVIKAQIRGRVLVVAGEVYKETADLFQRLIQHYANPSVDSMM